MQHACSWGQITGAAQQLSGNACARLSPILVGAPADAAKVYDSSSDKLHRDLLTGYPYLVSAYQSSTALLSTELSVNQARGQLGNQL